MVGRLLVGRNDRDEHHAAVVKWQTRILEVDVLERVCWFDSSQLYQCLRGGTGRRAGFRSRSTRVGVGSTPTEGTKPPLIRRTISRCKSISSGTLTRRKWDSTQMARRQPVRFY